ncbi:MAG: DNA-protecting protein DprA [Rhodospirillales bacterium]|nr:DNA-protecting protein DprA [Rhodospirillales bacterium]MCB9996743.1 DNA-protecting protein DprA [Rhodospirillales bacterium]
MGNTAPQNTPLSDEDKLSWLQLARTENVGPITFFKFLDYYGSAAKALGAIPALAERGGRKRPLSIPPRGAIEKEYERVKKLGGEIITAADPDYPLALSAIEDAPPVLTALGNIELLQQPSMAIVGARNASINGRKFAEKLAAELGAFGQVVSSGMARGIDTAAHSGALPTGTIAVVAGGIDVVYPSENQKLYEAIIDQGLVIAENPLGVSPRAQDFPRRNRIVSGLSQGVIVVEATVRSGSLITARLAGEQGRDVYAVPGHPLDPRASGPNALIRDGATLIRGIDDVLEELNNYTGGGMEDSGFTRFEMPPPAANDQPDEQDFAAAREMLLDALSFTPAEINDVIRHTGLGTAMAQTVLMELELAGRVQRLPGNRAMLVEE